MQTDKQTVRDFYDSYGWRKNKAGVYQDTAAFVDRRAVINSYLHKIHLRVKKFLAPSGNYFLDAGSGAIPHNEYLEYSSGYKWRVCLDFSQTALSEARSKVGEHGFYVLGDLARLPFKDSVFDVIVCAHVLYHVPENDQSSAIMELHRVLKPCSSCLVIYSWPNSLLTRAAIPVTIAKSILSKIGKKTRFILRTKSVVKSSLDNHSDCIEGNPSPRPTLYFFPHEAAWFKKVIPASWDVDIRCWSSVDTIFTRALVPNNVVGTLLMNLIFSLENIFPRLLGRIGRYPLIIIRKK